MQIKSRIIYLTILLMTTSITIAGNKITSKIKEENITYTYGSTLMKGFIAYNENLKGKRPAVLIVHEWWGLNDYPKMRARQLAELGYIAMAVDMYGDGKIATNPKEAQALASTFYSNPQLSKSRLDAALAQIKTFKQTDKVNIFAIGYCFGGSVVLNAAKLGSELKGVVSFHGGLAGVPANKRLLKAKILVCNGGNDKFVSENDINTFKHQLDSIGADYTFITYPNATHAFTNPASREVGKQFNMPIEYNKKADYDSWNDMLAFLKKIIK